MSVRRNEADSSHELDGLEHDVGEGRVDGPRQQRQRLLVLEHRFQTNLQQWFTSTVHELHYLKV